MAATITWPELIVLMGFGGGDGNVANESIRGTLYRRSTRQIDDDVTPEPGQRVVLHPTLGRMVVEESTVRILRRGERVRVERTTGEVTAIFGPETVFMFGHGNVATEHDRRRTSFGWAGAEIVDRPSPSRWEGNDFTTLTGPIEATEFLGRAAWAFELAPPRRKPYPLQMIVDAETGIVLRNGNRDFDSVSEWRDLEFGADLPDELFEWAGPTRSADDVRAERAAEHDRDMAERREWLVAHGLADLPLPAVLELMLHDRDDESGGFELGFELTRHGALLRRPLSTDDWDAVRHYGYDHGYRWSDRRWDWFLATDPALGDDDLDRIKRYLAGSS